MTNELEKTFFETFEINNCRTCDYHGLECWECDDIYPQITDHILLELICLIKTICIKCTTNQCEVIYADGAISYIGRDLKEAILNFLIPKVSIFKHQVRTLFEEG